MDVIILGTKNIGIDKGMGGRIPCGPVVRTPGSQCQGPGFHPWWRTWIPQAMWYDQKKKTAPKILWDFPGGPVHGTLPSNAKDSGLIPDLGGKIPYASWPRNQDIKQKDYHNKFNKNFKNGLHP